jgi:hypothetical protein
MNKSPNCDFLDISLTLGKKKTLSTHRLLDINFTKNVHFALQQIDPARNLKKWQEQVYT